MRLPWRSGKWLCLLQKYKTLGDFTTSKVRNYSIDFAFMQLYLCSEKELRSISIAEQLAFAAS